MIEKYEGYGAGRGVNRLGRWSWAKPGGPGFHIFFTNHKISFTRNKEVM